MASWVAAGAVGSGLPGMRALKPFASGSGVSTHPDKDVDSDAGVEVEVAADAPDESVADPLLAVGLSDPFVA